MAIWQYQLTIIPKESILKKYSEIPEKLFIDKEAWENYWNKWKTKSKEPEIDFEDAKTINWWQNINIDIEKTVSDIDKLITRGDWSNCINFIGWKGDSDNNQDNDCHIAYNAKTRELSEFQFRTDLRSNKNVATFLKGILEICSNNELMVMNLEGFLFEPKIKLILEDLKTSNAIAFLSDPLKFIEKVKTKRNNKTPNHSNKNIVWTKINSV